MFFFLLEEKKTFENNEGYVTKEEKIDALEMIFEGIVNFN
jgi:hypothetical protein